MEKNQQDFQKCKEYATATLVLTAIAAYPAVKEIIRDIKNAQK